MQLTGSRSTKKTDSSAAGSVGGLRRLPDRLAAAMYWLRSARRHYLLPGVTLPARPGLLVLTMILLVGLCAALASWGIRTPPDRAGFVLLTGASSPNLNNNSTETSASPSGPMPETAGGKDSQNADRFASRVQPVSAPVPAPPSTEPGIPAEKSVVRVPEPPALTPPPAVPELPLDPRPLSKVETVLMSPTEGGLITAKRMSTTRDPHPGDDLMMRTWNWNVIGLKTLMAAVLAASPSLAEKTSGPLSQSEKLDEIQKQLDEMKKPLADIPKAIVALTRVEKELKDLRAEYLAGVQQEQNQINELKRQIDQLKRDLETVRSRESGVTRSSLFPPPEPGAAATMGRVEIRNTYPEEVAVAVNKRVYHVPPGETVISDPVLAGTFTYEVLGVTPPRTRTVTPGKAFLVHVHPQR